MKLPKWVCGYMAVERSPTAPPGRGCAGWELRVLEQHSSAHSRQLGVRTHAVRAAGNHQCGNDRPRDRCPKAKMFGQESLRATLLLTDTST